MAVHDLDDGIMRSMREKLEQHQVWIYLIAILSGMAIGWTAPDKTRLWELWLLLVVFALYLVELFGMVVYLRWVPGRLIRDDDQCRVGDSGRQ